MKTRTFHLTTLISAPLSEVFRFFSDAENLEKLTPSSLKFKILSPTPIEMREGTIIDYRLTLMGVPFRWKTKIEVWEPDRCFVDNQERGPYLRWHHTHAFEAQGETTLMNDRVEYAVPGGILEPIIHALFVGPQVKAIFAFRTQAISKVFGSEA